MIGVKKSNFFLGRLAILDPIPSSFIVSCEGYVRSIIGVLIILLLVFGKCHTIAINLSTNLK